MSRRRNVGAAAYRLLPRNIQETSVCGDALLARFTREQAAAAAAAAVGSAYDNHLYLWLYVENF